MLALMLTLMVGFGVAFGLLAPSFRASGTGGPIYLFRDANNCARPAGPSFACARARDVTQLARVRAMCTPAWSGLDLSAGSSLWQAMYAVFGEFDLAEITSSTGAAVITPLIFGVYLFIVVMPIINLLVPRLA